MNYENGFDANSEAARDPPCRNSIPVCAPLGEPLRCVHNDEENLEGGKMLFVWPTSSLLERSAAEAAALKFTC